MIYFDNAATTFPKPQSVLKAMSQAAANFGANPGRSGHSLSIKTSEKIYGVREKAAKFFGAEPENVVFAFNCTHALNMAIKGSLKSGDHVVISQLEHNSIRRPVHALNSTGQVTYTTASVRPDNPDATAASFERAIRRNTTAVICTHASNVTG